MFVNCFDLMFTFFQANSILYDFIDVYDVLPPTLHLKFARKKISCLSQQSISFQSAFLLTLMLFLALICYFEYLMNREIST